MYTGHAVTYIQRCGVVWLRIGTSRLYVRWANVDIFSRDRTSPQHQERRPALSANRAEGGPTYERTNLLYASALASCKKMLRSRFSLGLFAPSSLACWDSTSSSTSLLCLLTSLGTNREERIFPGGITSSLRLLCSALALVDFYIPTTRIRISVSSLTLATIQRNLDSHWHGSKVTGD